MGKKDYLLNVEFEGDEVADFLVDAASRISVSGAQEKFPAVEDHGTIRLARPGERSTHILKPAPWDQTLQNRKMIPANEYLTMQLASRVYGIETAENYLCFTPKQSPVYVTKRFDVGADGERFLMEDFASVLGKTAEAGRSAYKYEGSYLEIANAIRRYVPAWRVDMEKFFKVLIFNYIYANGDAHLKNFTLIVKDGERRLAPAYDLLNTSLHLQGDDFALSYGLGTAHSGIFDRTGHACREDFELFASEIGLSHVRYSAILDAFASTPAEVDWMIDSSSLPEKLKRTYRRIVSERVSRFNRK